MPSVRGGYSEKVSLLQVRQSCPLLYLRYRSRDLVNRGGGDLVAQVHAVTPEDSVDGENRVPLLVNGIVYNVNPGGSVRLAPGDSVRIPARTYHQLSAEKAGCLLGEVSTVCDEKSDYHFRDPLVQRFPEIEEDEPPLHLLCREYPEVE